MLMFFWLFVTWIGKKTVPALVDVEDGEDEEYEEEYDNDDGIIELPTIVILLFITSTGIVRINDFYNRYIYICAFFRSLDEYLPDYMKCFS